MADRIKLLPDSVANQIAAGEVVNRPASVVKELMENAVDASSRSVTVNFKDGGKQLIQIKDDGAGMSAMDARMAFDRHATSKISEVEDIYKLMTFGFRGEALASIAAVAQVELQTRQQEDETGVRILIDGGKFISQNAVACSKGAQFFVRNLFYNVPARRRFLDKSVTEAGHIMSEFQRVALCHPEVEFKLYNNDAPIYDLPQSTLKQRVIGVVGKSIAGKLLDISATTSIVTVSGFIGSPASAKQRNKEQFLFVNGRYFKSPYFHKAVLQAYEKLIPKAVQPSYFIYLEIDPQAIDVNVHPQKTEIKFSDNIAVWQIINAAVRETLAKTGVVPLMDFDTECRADLPVITEDKIVREPSSIKRKDYNPFIDYAEPKYQRRADISDFVQRYEFKPEPNDSAPYRSNDSSHGSSHEDLPNFRQLTEQPVSAENISQIPSANIEFIDEESEMQSSLDLEQTNENDFSNIFYIGKGYATAVYGGSLIVADLRRARESIAYHGYISMIKSDNNVTERLLFPEKMVLSIDDFTLLQETQGEFMKFGFDIKFLDNHAIEICGVPADTPIESLDEVIYQMLDTIRDSVLSPAEMRREKLATIMAKNVSKGISDPFSDKQAQTILSALSRCDNIRYTPTGKAVFTEIGFEEIKNRLK